MIRTIMTDSIEFTDMMKPHTLTTEMSFDEALPFEVYFLFHNKDGSKVGWHVGRQLILDGLDAVMLTGMGDVKCRSNSDRFILKLSSPEGTASVSLPREQVKFVLDEAESLCPLADVDLAVEDSEIESLLNGEWP